MDEKSVGSHWFIKVEFGDDSEFVCLPTERKMKEKKILFLSTTLFSVSWALGKWEKLNKCFYKTAVWGVEELHITWPLVFGIMCTTASL